MAAVGMVQVAGDEVIHVVAVGHFLVAASGPVHMAGIVALAFVGGRAAAGIRCGNLQRALVEMIPVRAVQAPVVQVIDVVAVLDRRVPATFPVNVAVVAVDLVPLAVQGGAMPPDLLLSLREATLSTARRNFGSTAWIAPKRCRCCARG
jgi:hypothetical protein